MPVELVDLDVEDVVFTSNRIGVQRDIGGSGLAGHFCGRSASNALDLVLVDKIGAHYFSVSILEDEVDVIGLGFNGDVTGTGQT